MLAKIVDFSLRHRGVVLTGALATCVLGLLALARLPFDAFPDTTPVQVQVNTAAPALAPLEIERQIVWPIEQALSGLPRLREIRSISRFGLGQVTAVFDDGADLWRSRQAVSERLTTVDLAPGIERPSLGPVATGLGEVLHYLVTGPGATLEELRTAHDWIVRPQLRSVPGTAEVNAWGGDVRELHVVIDPARLAGFGLTLEEVCEALEANTGSAGGGVLERAGEATLVQGLALATAAADVEQIVVAARDGVPVFVRDVARVANGRETRRGAVTADGKGEAVLGLAFMLTGENSHDVTRRLALRLDEIRRTLPAGIDVAPVYERTDLVDHVLATVSTNLLEGALLVVAVLFAFLGNLRAGLIVATAIPFSLLFAFDAMLRAGVAGTLMSLGAIDFGLVVDSGVIVVENAERRLAEAGPDADRREVVRAATLEVRRPTVFGELIIAAVYLPILFLGGVEGKLFRPMALTVVFALVGSALYSLTVVPALASLALRPGRRASRHREPWLARVLAHAYRPLLALALRRRAAVLGGIVLLLGASGLLAFRLGAEFVPRLQEGTIVVNTVRLAGVSIGESVRYGTAIERALLAAFPDEIDRIWTRTGSAEVLTDPMGIEVSDVFLQLAPRERWRRAKTQDELSDAVSGELSQLPGMRTVMTQPIEMRLAEMTAGVRADLAIKIFGDDLDTLRALARQVESAVRGVPGAVEVLTEQLTGQPTLQVEVDRAAVARLGISAADVLAVVDALGGRRVGTLHEGDRRFPIVARLDEAYRQAPEALGAVFVTGPGGTRVPLSSVARLAMVTGPAAIQREWGQRRIVVQANVHGRDLAGFVAAARAAVDRVAMPPGYHVRLGGEFEHLESAKRRLAVVIPATLLLIALLLYATYGNVLDAARVFTGVPLAAAGGVVALWLRGMPFSVSAGVGFIALSGVSVLADMVLVSTIRQLQREGLALREAIVAAAERRLRPVLMTGLVASVGFLPMALNTGIGAEVQRPLATVVIGGVMTSVALTLIVLPVIASLRRDAGAAEAHADG